MVAAAAVVGAYTFIEFLTGLGDAAIRLRDLAPFVYLISIPIFADAESSIGTAGLMTAISAALWIHLSWLIPASLGYLHPITLPVSISDVPAFLPRADYDGAVLVSGALFALSRKKAGFRSKVTIPFAILSLVPIPLLGNRAAVLGLLATLVYLGIFQYRWLVRVLLAPRATIALSFITSVLLLVAIVAPSTLTSNLLAQRLGLRGEVEAARGAQGSAFGRRMAWELVWGAAVEDTKRIAIGWGPGAEIVRDTGALNYLSGDPTVRAPHNGFLHLFARYGVLGCMVWVGALVLLLASLPTLAVSPAERVPLRLLGGSLSSSILAAAAVGVVLESPFGALTLYFGLTIAGSSTVRHEEYESTMIMP
jgi:O-antigen ligase